MVKVIGLTGGMGTGKSTVATLFKEQGYPVYNSDLQAKKLMIEDEKIKGQIINLLGKEAYFENRQLDRAYIAKKIFSDSEVLKKQNALVHEAVRKDFLLWVFQQKTKFCIKEAAILFESGAYKDCDYTLAVIAPEKIRIQRIMDRDKLTLDEIKQRLKNQWSQARVRENADFCIVNDSDLNNLKQQVENIIHKLENK